MPLLRDVWSLNRGAYRCYWILFASRFIFLFITVWSAAGRGVHNSASSAARNWPQPPNNKNVQLHQFWPTNRRKAQLHARFSTHFLFQGDGIVFPTRDPCKKEQSYWKVCKAWIGIPFLNVVFPIRSTHSSREKCFSAKYNVPCQRFRTSSPDLSLCPSWS